MTHRTTQRLFTFRFRLIRANTYASLVDDVNDADELATQGT